MTHDSPDPHGDGTLGSELSQANFLGGLGIGLMVLMAVFAAVVLIAAFG